MNLSTSGARHRLARGRVGCVVGLVSALLLMGASGRAWGEGFQLERYEPASAGNWFFAVQHPWYSATRWAAAGLTLDYGHNTLWGGTFEGGTFVPKSAIVEHQLVGHLDVAGSFLDRVQLSLSLPIVLREVGQAGFGLAPLDGAAVGDPRFAVLVRLWNHAEQHPLSVHAGLSLWLPVGGSAKNVGDPGARLMPELVLAGFARGHLRWSAATSLLLRGTTTVGTGPASSVGSEWQLRAGLAWGDSARTWHVGPEAWLTTAISGDAAFARASTTMELLLGAQINLLRTFQLGAALGTGVVSSLGTPDMRVIVRLAWAPHRQKLPGDTDGDGVADAEDLCPDEKVIDSGPRAHGCTDEDADGLADAEDLCPRDSTGRYPDAARSGCPQPDQDDDGVPDAMDLCPDKRSGVSPDAERSGCPQPDHDDDGVPDAEDVCPNSPPGSIPDPTKKGCPLPDGDADGVADVDDLCPKVAAGKSPDPKRRGCPLPDADGDGVPDVRDACPKLPGPEDADRKRSGCPELSADRAALTELKMVRFRTNDAKLLPEGLPVLDELAGLLVRHPEVKRVVITGHADDTGTHQFNLRLSIQRAQAVVGYLVKKGVGKKRLKPVGYGDMRPLSSERTDEARTRNRRVEMQVR